MDRASALHMLPWGITELRAVSKSQESASEGLELALTRSPARNWRTQRGFEVAVSEGTIYFLFLLGAINHIEAITAA